MVDSKQLKIRISTQEKDFLELKAKDVNMSLNQYVRYKILETNNVETSNFDAIEFLNKQLPLITRVIIDSYFHIRKLSSEQMSKESLLEIEQSSEDQIKKLNISKK